MTQNEAQVSHGYLKGSQIRTFIKIPIGNTRRGVQQVTQYKLLNGEPHVQVSLLLMVDEMSL